MKKSGHLQVTTTSQEIVQSVSLLPWSTIKRGRQEENDLSIFLLLTRKSFMTWKYCSFVLHGKFHVNSCPHCFNINTILCMCFQIKMAQRLKIFFFSWKYIFSNLKDKYLLYILRDFLCVRGALRGWKHSSHSAF